MIALKQLLDLLPPNLLDQLALQHHVDARNQVRLRGSTVFVCLLNGLLNHGDLTQRLLEDTYQTHFQPHTHHRADHSSFGKRLIAIKPAYFASIFAFVHHQIAPQATPGETRALRLRFVDATSVTLSAKLLAFGLPSGTRKGRASRRTVKSVLDLQEGLPQLLHLCRQPSESSDCVALGETMLAHSQPGDLWVFDKGMYDRTRLLALSEAGAFFLTPHKDQGLHVQKTLWQSAQPAPTQEPGTDEPSFVVTEAELAYFQNGSPRTNQNGSPRTNQNGSPRTNQNGSPRTKWRALPLLLVRGVRFDARTQQWQPLMLMTNLPVSVDGRQAGPYTFEQVAELYRRRWEIETMFKFLKQHLGYRHLTSRSANGIEVMIYMSLIAALLLIWYKRQSGIDRGWRSVRFWFAEEVRQWTQQALSEDWQASLVNTHPPGVAPLEPSPG